MLLWKKKSDLWLGQLGTSELSFRLNPLLFRCFTKLGNLAPQAELAKELACMLENGIISPVNGSE